MNIAARIHNVFRFRSPMRCCLRLHNWYVPYVHRCPAYVDLYARSPKLQGTWTVYVVVKRGSGGKGKGGGEFALRSSKNLSILPANVVRGRVDGRHGS